MVSWVCAASNSLWFSVDTDGTFECLLARELSDSEVNPKVLVVQTLVMAEDDEVIAKHSASGMGLQVTDDKTEEST